MINKVDVLYCVEKKDINPLLKKSLQLCVQNFKLLNDIYIVTNDADGIKKLLFDLNLPVECHVLQDDEVISKGNIPGWFLQQMIKLKAHFICKTKYICIIGADALLLHPITEADLFSQGDQILYYNRYPFTPNHLEYERKRIINVAKILQCNPYNSYLLGDFIMELMIFNATYLIELLKYLSNIYGEDPIYRIIDNMSSDSLMDKTCFGEWTLYAVFLLDVLNLSICIKNSDSKFVEQLHSINDLYLHSPHAKVVHCVNKDIDKKQLSDVLGIVLEEELI